MAKGCSEEKRQGTKMLVTNQMAFLFKKHVLEEKLSPYKAPSKTVTSSYAGGILKEPTSQSAQPQKCTTSKRS